MYPFFMEDHFVLKIVVWNFFVGLSYRHVCFVWWKFFPCATIFCEHKLNILMCSIPVPSYFITVATTSTQ